MESNINSVISKDAKKSTFVKIVDIQQTMFGSCNFTFDPRPQMTPDMTFDLKFDRK